MLIKLLKSCFSKKKSFPYEQCSEVTEHELSQYKGLLSSLNQRSFLSDRGRRADAENHALLAECYKKIEDPKGMYHAYMAFQSLSHIQETKWSDNDCARLIACFNYYMQEFPTHRKDLPFKDYQTVLLAVKKFEKSDQDHFPLIATYKDIGMQYVRRGEQEKALDFFLKATEGLHQSIFISSADNKKMLLRVIEMHYRSIKCVFPSGSLEHRIFSCASLMFSSPLKLSESQRLDVFTNIMKPLIEEILAQPTKHPYHKIFLQQLKMLWDACEKELFPFGVFEWVMAEKSSITFLNKKIDELQKQLFFDDRELLVSEATGTIQESNICPSLSRK